MVDVNEIPFGELNDPYLCTFELYWHCIGGASLPDHGAGCGEKASVIIQGRVIDQIEKIPFEHQN